MKHHQKKSTNVISLRNQRRKLQEEKFLKAMDQMTTEELEYQLDIIKYYKKGVFCAWAELIKRSKPDLNDPDYDDDDAARSLPDRFLQNIEEGSLAARLSNRETILLTLVALKAEIGHIDVCAPVPISRLGVLCKTLQNLIKHFATEDDRNNPDFLTLAKHYCINLDEGGTVVPFSG